MNMWSITKYEAFETFLRDITATLLHIHKHLADPGKLSRFKPKSAQPNLTNADIEFWQEFVRYSHANNEELLKYVRQLAPTLPQAEQHNNRVLDLNDWFNVIGEVRHATTHSGFLIKPQRLRGWSTAKRHLLTDCVDGTSIARGYEMEATKENVKYNLRLLAEYAFIVFKFLSQTQNYDWKILRKSL